MIWFVILGMAVIVFFNRYIFIYVNFKLPVFIESILRYAAPSLMVAMCLPIIFYKEDHFRGIVENIYLYAAILTIFVVLYTKNMLLSIVLSLVGFYGLTYFCH